MPTQNKALPFLIVAIIVVAIYANQSEIIQEQGIFSFLKGLFGKKDIQTSPPPISQNPTQMPIQTQPPEILLPQQCRSDDTILLARLSIAEQSNRLLYEENVKLNGWVKLCKNYVPPKCPANRYEIEIGCSGSMLPNFHCNWRPRVYIPSDVSEIRVCDVVAAKNPTSSAGRVFHRVVGMNDSGGVRHYVLKGDANPNVDSYQPTFTDIERKVCYE